MSKKLALKIMIGMVTLILAFQGSIMAQIIPYDYIWAGRLQSVQEMYRFVSVSVALNLILLITLLIKAGYVKLRIPEKLLNVILGIYVVIFILNSVGNLFAQQKIEAIIFVPWSIVMVVLLCWVLFKKSAAK